MTPVEAAWAAGLYEGEGSVTLSFKRSRPRVQFCLCSTDEDVLRKFASVMRVGRVTGPYTRANRKTFWHWRAHGFNVARMISRELGPHLGKRRTNRLQEVLAAELPPAVRPPVHNRKLTMAEARVVRSRLAAGERQCVLVRETGLSQAQIWKIQTNRTYIETTTVSGAPSTV